MSAALKTAFEKALAEMREQLAARVALTRLDSPETPFEKGRRLQLAEDLARVEGLAKILEAP